MMEKKIHYKMHKVKKIWVAIGVTTLAPVSYTHLDVYKRQVWQGIAEVVLDLAKE